MKLSLFLLFKNLYGKGYVLFPVKNIPLILVFVIGFSTVHSKLYGMSYKNPLSINSSGAPSGNTNDSAHNAFIKIKRECRQLVPADMGVFDALSDPSIRINLEKENCLVKVNPVIPKFTAKNSTCSRSDLCEDADGKYWVPDYKGGWIPIEERPYL